MSKCIPLDPKTIPERQADFRNIALWQWAEKKADWRWHSSFNKELIKKTIK